MCTLPSLRFAPKSQESLPMDAANDLLTTTPVQLVTSQGVNPWELTEGQTLPAHNALNLGMHCASLARTWRKLTDKLQANML